jgi:hypothetical protein
MKNMFLPQQVPTSWSRAHVGHLGAWVDQDMPQMIEKENVVLEAGNSLLDGPVIARSKPGPLGENQDP